MSDEHSALVRPSLCIVIKKDTMHCGISCPYLKQDNTLWSCALFRCDLYTGLKYIERNPLCKHSMVIS